MESQLKLKHSIAKFGNLWHIRNRFFNLDKIYFKRFFINELTVLMIISIINLAAEHVYEIDYKSITFNITQRQVNTCQQHFFVFL